jgi:uncharacterized protein (TIGR02757 family)
LKIADFKLKIGEHDVALKAALDRLYASFNYADSAIDPIQIVRRYQRPEDREVVGFCAASLAFGRVASVMESVGRLVGVMGEHPAAYVRQFHPHRDGAAVGALGHRWTRGVDLAALVWVLRQMIDRAGSIEGFFVDGDRGSGPDIEASIESFSSRALALDLTAVYGPPSARGRARAREGVAYFFPRPSCGSGCKRLNLFLRWMVRRDALDLGVWTRVSPARLIVPLDTHVIRVGRCLGLTRYTSPGWKMAREITAALRALDPEDPVKYDYALCHLGMMDACGFGTAQRDAQCPLRGTCQPKRNSRSRKRAPSRKSSVRR